MKSHKKSELQSLAEVYAPLSAAAQPLNEFWETRYFNYNPGIARINPYGGGLDLNMWSDYDATEKGGYLPMFCVQAFETSGVSFVEFTQHTQGLVYQQCPNLYGYLESKLWDLWESQPRREQWFQNMYDRDAEVNGVIEWSGLANVLTECQAVVLVFKWGQEDRDSLQRVVRIQHKRDWSYVWDLVPALDTTGGHGSFYETYLPLSTVKHYKAYTPK
jgi:hypothetical protein